MIKTQGMRIRWCTLLYLFMLFSGIYIPVAFPQEKSPSDVVKLFDQAYGSPLMDAVAPYTTPHFRDNRPQSVWVIETWKALKELQYQRLTSATIDCKVKDNKAIVVMEATIKTAAGQTSQTEIYYLIKEQEQWLIDKLIVTDEAIDPEKITL